jgi:hypothetical protein
VVARQAMITGNGALTINADPSTTVAAAASLSIAPAGFAIPSFSWNNVSGAGYYSLILIDTTANTVVTDTLVSGTSFKPATPLAAQDTYVWYVAAWKPDGQLETLSAPQTFVLDPKMQQLLQPSLQ